MKQVQLYKEPFVHPDLPDRTFIPGLKCSRELLPMHVRVGISWQVREAVSSGGRNPLRSYLWDELFAIRRRDIHTVPAVMRCVDGTASLAMVLLWGFGAIFVHWIFIVFAIPFLYLLVKAIKGDSYYETS